MSHLSAMVKLAEVIVGAGGQANIQFSNIPQTYRSLQILYQARSDAAVNNTTMLLQINGDTGANYDWIQYDANIAGTGPGTGAGAGATSMQLGYLTGANPTAGNPSEGQLTIINYAATVFRKGVEGITSMKETDAASNIWSSRSSGYWRSTAAITSILLFPANGNFVAGSVCSLYGIV